MFFFICRFKFGVEFQITFEGIPILILTFALHYHLLRDTRYRNCISGSKYHRHLPVPIFLTGHTYSYKAIPVESQG